MSRNKVSKSHPILGRLARWLVAALARLPIGAAQRLGAVVGWLAWLLPTMPRKVTRLNLEWCLPELSRAERRRLARASLVETGKTIGESGAMYFWPPARLAALEEGVEGDEILERSMAAGSGVLLLLLHLGNWEMMNHFLMARHPFTALYRPPRIRELGDTLVASRERTGCTMVPATPQGVRRLFRALDAGRLVIVLPDQEPVRASGVFAPFFGVPAITMKLVQRLLARTGATPLVAWVERTPAGRFRLHFETPPAGLDDADAVVAATRLNEAIEGCVRRRPEQYSWSYKRFKTRPPDEEHALRVLGDLSRVRLYDRRGL